ncbi:MAG: hypothetical protein ISR69_00895 [Gammaproteobacteria bacterium]|nr:hypothetical protein [Gammaproteobacteria bacterium]
MNFEKIFEELHNFQAADSLCKKVYCTTCAGLAYAVKNNMTAKLRGDIKFTLSEMTVSEFNSLGEWGQLFQDIAPIDVCAIFEREEENINTTDIRELDQYLLDSRKLMRHKTSYKKLLEQGIKTAIETSDDSLIETVSIILGKDIMNNKMLLSLALKKSYKQLGSE